LDDPQYGAAFVSKASGTTTRLERPTSRLCFIHPSQPGETRD
jgi:hypothetical protein